MRDQRSLDEDSNPLIYRTVWYELLFGMWPFSGQPSEVIIWQVGKGIKQPINNFQASKEVKVRSSVISLVVNLYLTLGSSLSVLGIQIRSATRFQYTV